jgi:hypothetical protein
VNKIALRDMRIRRIFFFFLNKWLKIEDDERKKDTRGFLEETQDRFSKNEFL